MVRTKDAEYPEDGLRFGRMTQGKRGRVVVPKLIGMEIIPAYKMA